MLRSYGRARAFGAKRACTRVSYRCRLCQHRAGRKRDNCTKRDCGALEPVAWRGFVIRLCNPSIAALLVLLTALGIGGRPLSELLPGIAADVFHSGAGGLSLLASSMGGGAILGGLWLGQWTHSSNLTEIAVGSSIVAAVIAVAIASSTMWVALPAVAIVGLSISCAGIAIQSSIAAQPRYPRLELFWAPRSNA